LLRKSGEVQNTNQLMKVLKVGTKIAVGGPATAGIWSGGSARQDYDRSRSGFEGCEGSAIQSVPGSGCKSLPASGIGAQRAINRAAIKPCFNCLDDALFVAVIETDIAKLRGNEYKCTDNKVVPQFEFSRRLDCSVFLGWLSKRSSANDWMRAVIFRLAVAADQMYRRNIAPIIAPNTHSIQAIVALHFNLLVFVSYKSLASSEHKPHRPALRFLPSTKHDLRYQRPSLA
jgi:hypothetical protein